MTNEETIMVYHGTSLEKAIQIALDGAILSPFGKFLREMQILQKENPKLFERCAKHYGTSELDELALKRASIGYNEREIEHRVKCISLIDRFENAYGHADECEKFLGGIVLGIKISKRNRGNLTATFIPKEQSLDSLKKVAILPKSMERIGLIKEAYLKYNPEFFGIDKKRQLFPIQ